MYRFAFCFIHNGITIENLAFDRSFKVYSETGLSTNNSFSTHSYLKGEISDLMINLLRPVLYLQ